jgi:hypothetical protein
MALTAPIVPAQIDVMARMRAHAATIALFAVIGIELMVLATWTPQTLRVWFDPETQGYGDFKIFFANAKSLSLTNMYSPGLALLLHPLTKLPMDTAFAIYTGVNVAALGGVAYAAQRGVASMPAKIAVALGVFALPQTHWSLRIGHFTQIMALAALCGLLMSDRRPVVAGVCIALLALKPQYLPVPLMYLLVTRNWRAFGTAAGGLALLGIAGVAAMTVREPSGIGMFGYTASYYVESVPDILRHITVGQGDANYTQSWQYSWYGFLVSIDVDRNPGVVMALTALSLAGVLIAWRRCTPSVAKAAAALGMLLITPHTTFYNWSMLSVAFVLLLHSDLRPRWLVPSLVAMMAVAAAATQDATPWPLPLDRYRPAGTLGVYWLQPAALASIIALAIAGRRSDTPLETSAPSRLSMLTRPRLTFAEPGFATRMPPLAPVALLCGVALFGGYAVSAYASGSGPFRSDRFFSRAQVLRALPADFPAPLDATLRDAGRGGHLPYRIEWSVPAPVSEVAGAMRTRLDDGAWTLAPAADDGDPSTIDLRSTRSAGGDLPLVAELRIAADQRGSVLRLEFSPLPASSVPGYDDWLRSIGLVVHDVDPSLVDR